MNEPKSDVLTEAEPAEPRQPGPLAPLAKLVLGPNEDLLLRPYTPYLPAFNLAPAPQPPSIPLLMAVATLLSAVLVGGAWLAFSAHLQAIDAQIQETEAQAARMKLENQRYETLDRMVKLVASQKTALDTVAGGAPRWASILDALRTYTPSGLRYSSVKGDASGMLYLQGQAEDLKSLGSFMVNLRGSGSFYRPSLGMGRRQEVEGQRVVNFDLRTRVITPDWLVSPEFLPATASAKARGKR